MDGKLLRKAAAFSPLFYSSYHSLREREERVFLTLNDDDDDDSDDESLVFFFVFFFFAEEQQPTWRKKSRSLVEENSFSNVF